MCASAASDASAQGLGPKPECKQECKPEFQNLGGGGGRPTGPRAVRRAKPNLACNYESMRLAVSDRASGLAA